MKKNKKLIIAGLFFILFGILLGATAAHYLEKIGVAHEHIESFKTGTRYLFYNGLGLLALAGISNQLDFTLRTSHRFIVCGTILFSGSIFLLVILPVLGVSINKIIGPLTPLGGLVMIIGWGSTLFKALRTIKS